MGLPSLASNYDLPPPECGTAATSPIKPMPGETKDNPIRHMSSVRLMAQGYKNVVLSMGRLSPIDARKRGPPLPIACQIRPKWWRRC